MPPLRYIVSPHDDPRNFFHNALGMNFLRYPDRVIPVFKNPDQYRAFCDYGREYLKTYEKHMTPTQIKILNSLQKYKLEMFPLEAHVNPGNVEVYVQGHGSPGKAYIYDESGKPIHALVVAGMLGRMGIPHGSKVIVNSCHSAAEKPLSRRAATGALRSKSIGRLAGNVDNTFAGTLAQYMPNQDVEGYYGYTGIFPHRFIGPDFEEKYSSAVVFGDVFSKDQDILIVESNKAKVVIPRKKPNYVVLTPRDIDELPPIAAPNLGRATLKPYQQSPLIKEQKRNSRIMEASTQRQIGEGIASTARRSSIIEETSQRIGSDLVESRGRKIGEGTSLRPVRRSSIVVAKEDTSEFGEGVLRIPKMRRRPQVDRATSTLRLPQLGEVRQSSISKEKTSELGGGVLRIPRMRRQPSVGRAISPLRLSQLGEVRQSSISKEETSELGGGVLRMPRMRRQPSTIGKEETFEAGAQKISDFFEPDEQQIEITGGAKGSIFKKSSILGLEGFY